MKTKENQLHYKNNRNIAKYFCLISSQNISYIRPNNLISYNAVRWNVLFLDNASFYDSWKHICFCFISDETSFFSFWKITNLHQQTENLWGLFCNTTFPDSGKNIIQNKFPQLITRSDSSLYIPSYFKNVHLFYWQISLLIYLEQHVFQCNCVCFSCLCLSGEGIQRSHVPGQKGRTEYCWSEERFEVYLLWSLRVSGAVGKPLMLLLQYVVSSAGSLDFPRWAVGAPSLLFLASVRIWGRATQSFWSGDCWEWKLSLTDNVSHCLWQRWSCRQLITSQSEHSWSERVSHSPPVHLMSL